MISTACSCDRLAPVVTEKHYRALLCISGFVIVWDCESFLEAREAHFDAAATIVRWPDVFYGACDEVLSVGVGIHVFS